MEDYSKFEENLEKASFAHDIMSEFEELLSYSDKCSTVVNVSLPKDTVLQECKYIRELPLNCYSIGNHRIYITREPKTPEVKKMQYIGCFWLLQNRQQPTLECRMHIESVCKFTCFTKALMLIVLEEVNNHKHYNELVSRWNLEMTKLTIDKKKENPEEATTFKKVHVQTDIFGILRAPTKEEMNEFLSWAKITAIPL
jgi:hypothetical protein